MNRAGGIEQSWRATGLGRQPAVGKAYSSSTPSDPSAANRLTSCPRRRSRSTRFQTSASSPPANGCLIGYCDGAITAIRSGCRVRDRWVSGAARASGVSLTSPPRGECGSRVNGYPEFRVEHCPGRDRCIRRVSPVRRRRPESARRRRARSPPGRRGTAPGCVPSAGFVGRQRSSPSGSGRVDPPCHCGHDSGDRPALGDTPEEAAAGGRRPPRRAPLALALHDIPQPAEGGAWYRRRRDAYAAMTDQADVVVVASEHERDSLERCCRDADGARTCTTRVVVVPLPVEPGKGAPPPPDVHELEVGVLGYLYPGKGIEDVLSAAACLRRSGQAVRVTCIGTVAEGHAEHAAALAARAAEVGIPFRVTGFVPDHELRSRLRAVAVPLAPHRHISASGSINTWLEAGRRPTSLPSPYAHELADRLPGTLLVVDDLETGILDALDHPERTWLGSGVVLGPSASEAGSRHADLLDELAQDAYRAGATATAFA